MRAVEDVVAAHRQRNRAPRLPSNPELATIRQQQSSISLRSRQPTSANVPAAHNNPDAPLHIEDQQEPTHSRIGRTAERTERSEPWQIQFYNPAVHDVLERAKQFSHCDAASVNAFPLRAQFNVKAAEYVEEAISERKSQGLFVGEGMVSHDLIVQLTLPSSPGWWPQHRNDICRLVCGYFSSVHGLQRLCRFGRPSETGVRP